MTQECKARRELAKYGLKLEKSRGRSHDRAAHGPGYRIREGMRLIVGSDTSGRRYPATLEDVEAWLTNYGGAAREA
jgi:hypothetical protein